MQTQGNSADYYLTNATAVSIANSCPRVGSVSVASVSSNPSPEIAYVEHQNCTPQSCFQLEYLIASTDTHQHRHQTQNNHEYQQQLQQPKAQNFQINRVAEERSYAHENVAAHDGYISDQWYLHHHHPQQPATQQLQPQTPSAYIQELVQQQQQYQQHHYQQTYVQQQQQQLLSSTPFAANAQVAQEPYRFGYAAAADLEAQAMAAAKESAPSNSQTSTARRKRKLRPIEATEAGPQASKTPKLESCACDEGIGDDEDPRLVASRRERIRTRELNWAYSLLRRSIPNLPSEKLSKFQTVRFAAHYIEFLHNLLEYISMDEAERMKQVGPKAAVLVKAYQLMKSAKSMQPSSTTLEKMSYSYSLWRVYNPLRPSPKLA